MAKWFKIFMALAVLTVFLIRVIPDIKKLGSCEHYDQFLLVSYDGVVLRKYIDADEHSYKTIVVKNLSDGSVEKIIIDSYIPDLYNGINVNDTIYKEVQNDSVFKIIDGRRRLLLKADFGCVR